MLSEAQIQLKAQQYNQQFEQIHQRKQNLLKKLELKVNSAAKVIQRMWRSYLIRKRNYYAAVIQKAWKKYKVRIERKRKIVKRFREVFFKGKIAWFVYKKYFEHKKVISQVQTTENQLKNYQTQSIVLTTFPSFITLSQTYYSQISYIQKLRQYQKQQFSQCWQSYQQKLKKQLQRQATKKWVKKNQTIWITQEGKELNLYEYIEKNVEKIFEREYNKYKETDKKLEGTVAVLKQKAKHFQVMYYRKVLEKNSKTK